MSRPHRLPLALTTALAVLALAGCGTAPAATPPAPATPPAAQATAAPASGLTVSDPWVKTADSGMTAVFGTFTAAGSTPVTVLSAQTSASPRTELHEVVMGDGNAMTMRQKEGGFVVEPGTPHSLAPGGDHIMIMDLTSPIRAGDQVEVTLSLSDGTTTEFTALAKDTTGGEENYESGSMDAPAAGGHGG